MPPARRLRSRVRSLRYRALLVVVVVVAMPVAWIWAAGVAEPGTILSLRRTLREATADAAAALADDPGGLDAVARAWRVRLRVLEGGAVVADHDHADALRFLEPVADPFYGPGGMPDLHGWDAVQPALPDRPEVREAGAEPGVRCEITEHGLLLACAAARRLPDGRVVHAERGSPRLVRSLYESRFQLTAVGLVVLGFGAFSALLVGSRIVTPIESLRDQVADRMREGAPTRPVLLDRDDELGELAAAFNQLLGAIAERNAANTAFAADLAHELKNPVAALRTATDLLAADRPLEGERKERLLRVLGDATARMDAVVQQFLELARAEAGLPGRARERFRLDDLVRRLAEAQAGAAFAVTGAPVEVEGVPERVETAVRNLLANAAQHAAGRVEVTVGPAGDEARVTVADDGPGVPEADLPRLFERYYTTREGGTGLGLALVKAIATAHQGRVEAASPPGGGARFTIALPRAR